ncbi:hypothetical protein pb186bvf_014309 [Paramecium bursaria]
MAGLNGFLKIIRRKAGIINLEFISQAKFYVQFYDTQEELSHDEVNHFIVPLSKQRNDFRTHG